MPRMRHLTRWPTWWSLHRVNRARLRERSSTSDVVLRTHPGLGPHPNSHPHHSQAAVAGHFRAAVGPRFLRKWKLALVDYLFAPDQLPHSYSASRELLQLLAESIRERKHLAMPPESLEEAPDVVCDMRMIVGAFQVTEGEPFYAWQEMTTPVEEARQTCLGVWRTQGGQCDQAVAGGVPARADAAALVLAACRDADLASRAYSIRRWCRPRSRDRHHAGQDRRHHRRPLG